MPNFIRKLMALPTTWTILTGVRHSLPDVPRTFSHGYYYLNVKNLLNLFLTVTLTIIHKLTSSALRNVPEQNVRRRNVWNLC